MPYLHCPQCSFSRSWKLRRHARKCKRCRKEWTPKRYPIKTIRLSESEWKELIQAILRYRTLVAIRLHVARSERLILKVLSLIRSVMVEDVPNVLSGTVEVDETYIAGMWHNKPWSIRKTGTKRGRGTSKQAIFGLRERARGVVRAFFIPDVKKRTIMPIIKLVVERGSTIYSDAYQLYQETPKEGYLHDFVDHHKNEYGRGDVHSNGMEGFWGFLKRRLKVTGGIRRPRLHLYVAEEVWRYNHRGQKEETRIRRLFELLQRKFGG